MFRQQHLSLLYCITVQEEGGAATTFLRPPTTQNAGPGCCVSWTDIFPQFEETRVMPPYAYVGSSSTSTERAERARLLAAGVSPRLASARGGAGAGEANTAGRPGSSSARGTNSSGAFSARVYYGAAAATNAQKLVSGAATHRAPRPPRYAIKPNNTIHEKESTRTKIHTSTDTNNTRTHTHTHTQAQQILVDRQARRREGQHAA